MCLCVHIVYILIIHEKQRIIMFVSQTTKYNYVVYLCHMIYGIYIVCHFVYCRLLFLSTTFLVGFIGVKSRKYI